MGQRVAAGRTRENGRRAAAGPLKEARGLP